MVRKTISPRTTLRTLDLGLAVENFEKIDF